MCLRACVAKLRCVLIIVVVNIYMYVVISNNDCFTYIINYKNYICNLHVDVDIDCLNVLVFIRSR